MTTRTYLAVLRTDAHHAVCDIEAETPAQAVARVRKIWAHDPTWFAWGNYEKLQGLNTITIEDQTGVVAAWVDPRTVLRDAAGDLLAALAALTGQIADLEGESSCIDEDLMQGEAYRDALRAIAKAKGGAA